MRKLLLAIVSFAFGSSAFAEAVSVDDALLAAEKWCGRNGHLATGAGEAVEAVPETDADGTLLWYVVRMSEGARLVVAPDTCIDPVLAVLGGELDPTSLFRAMLRTDVRNRLKKASVPTAAATKAAEKWQQLLGRQLQVRTKKKLMSAAAPLAMPTTIVHYLPEFATGKLTFWRQFKDYTPKNYSAGCVAAAGAVLMQYFNVTNALKKTKACKVDGKPKTLTTLGADYDWSIMPRGGEQRTLTTAEQQDLAARAVFDVGVCVGTDYRDGGKTSATLDDLADVLRDDCGFADVRCATVTAETQYEALIYAQIRAGAPVLLGIESKSEGGHVVVAVGYGEDADKTAYTRLFMGWGGDDDAWYALPNIEVSDDEKYTVIERVLTMIGRTEETMPVYGCVLANDGSPAAYETVTVDDVATMTDENGYWGLRLPPSAGNHACVCGGVTKSVRAGAAVARTTELMTGADLSAAMPSVVNFTIPAEKAFRAYVSPNEALQVALRDGKPLYVMVGPSSDEDCVALKRELRADPEFGKKYVFCCLNTEQDALGFDDGTIQEYPATGIFDPRKFSVSKAWQAGLLGTGNTADEREAVWTEWEKCAAEPTSLGLTADIPDSVAMPTQLKAVLTFPDGTETVLERGATFRLVKGDAATLSDDNVLTPKQKFNGTVTVEVSGSFWGRHYESIREISIVDATTLVGLRVEGPDVIDLYDVKEAKFAAIGVFGGGSEMAVAATFSVEDSIGGARIAKDGLVTFNNTNQYSRESSVIVRAEYQGKMASMTSEVRGWEVSLHSWSAKSMAVYGGASEKVVPLMVQWHRHGVTEDPTDDLTGVSFRVYGEWIYYGTKESDKEWVGYLSDRNSMVFEVPASFKGKKGTVSVAVTVRSQGASGRRDDLTWCHFDLLPRAPDELVNVTFLSPDGAPASQTIAYEGGQPYGTFPSPYRRGYYAEWKTEDGTDVTEETYCPSSDTTLWVNWMSNWYNFEFNANAKDAKGSMKVQSHYYDEERALRTNTFTRSGYVFGGWSLTPDGDVAFQDGELICNLTDQCDVTYTLYAIWVKDGYTIVMDPNGGTGAQVVRVCPLKGSIQLPSRPFSRPGYAFSGWSRTPDGEGELIPDGAEIEKLASKAGETVTLYAIWKEPTLDAIEIVGPAVIDLYDGNYDCFAARGRLTDGSVIDLQPTWYAEDPDDPSGTNVVIDATGFVSVVDPTAYAEPKRLTVRATCGAASASTSVEARGWSVELTDWTTDSYVYWPGQSGTVKPYAVRWRRHGVIESPTTDLTGITLVEPYFRVNDKSLAGQKVDSVVREGIKFTIPKNSEEDGSLSVFAWLWAEVNGQWQGTWIYSDGFLGGPRTFLSRYLKSAPPSTVNVVFSPEGGLSAGQKAKYAVGMNYLFLPDAYRTNYQFDGWYTAKDGGSRITAESDCAATVKTLYAHWTYVGYHIVYDRNDGRGEMADQELGLGQSGSLRVCAFSRTGYSFAGWSRSPSGPVEFYDGGQVCDLTTTAGAMVRLYAVWNPNAYVIRYQAHGGNGAMAATECLYDTGVKVASNAFVRTGYSFVGWARSAGGNVVFREGEAVSNLTAAADGTVDLFAVWKANAYTVTFDGAGAVGEMDQQAMEYDATATLPSCTFTKTGYHHEGWVQVPDGEIVYADGANVMNLTSEKGGMVTLRAVWGRNAYAIRYDANGGTGTMDEDACLYDLSAIVSSNEFERVGYSFAGWALDANGRTNDVKYVGGETVENLTAEDGAVINLFAVWSPNHYRLVFRDNGVPCGIDDRELAYDAETTMPTSCTGDDVNKLIGWKTAQGETLRCGSTVKNLADVDGADVELTAVWGENVPRSVAVDEAFSSETANVYDGYVVDAAGLPVGIVQAKTSKKNKSGVVTVTATVTDQKGKTWNYSGGTVGEKGVVIGLQCTKAGCPFEKALALTFGRNGMEGSCGGAQVFGARQNEFPKDQTSWTVAMENGDWLQFVVDAKGAVKGTGLAQGKTYAVSTRLIVGDTASYVAVVSGENRTLVAIDESSHPVTVVSSTSGEMSEGGATTAPVFKGWTKSPAAIVGIAFRTEPVMGSLGWPMTFKSSGKLPTGCKLDAKTGVISGVPTKAGTYVATVTATSGSNKKWTAVSTVTNQIEALPANALGTFNGFVRRGDASYGTLALTVSDVGKLSAKVTTAAATVSFSAAGWDSLSNGVYRSVIETKSGDRLAIVLDTNKAWNEDQLQGEFVSSKEKGITYDNAAQHNAFEKTWAFKATGDDKSGWSLALTNDVKSADVKVTLAADGKTALAGTLKSGATSYKLSAKGFVDVGLMTDGGLVADFVVILSKEKKAISVKTDLLFARKFGQKSGTAKIVR